MPKDTTMSAREAARQLGVGLQQVYRLIWEGRLDGEKTDGQWRVSAEAVESRQKARGE
jgi:excisionase family DNA binding protein